jgi:hypothetical protein
MLRRIGMILVLMLALSVLSPAVWACASNTDDCCAGSIPCDTGEAAAAVCGTTSASAVPTDTMRGGCPPLDHAIDTGAQPFRTLDLPRYLLTERPRNPGGHTELLYLRTGRLRL